MPVKANALRSEAIGVKWSNIDFDAKRINIWHKVVQEEMEEGGRKIVGYDTMKNKSSRNNGFSNLCLQTILYISIPRMAS